MGGLVTMRAGRRAAGRRGGFALADFLAGTLLFTGALLGFATMTQAKTDALAQAEQQAWAVAEAERAADRVRVAGLPAAPQGEPDPDGFRLVGTFAPSAPLAAVTGRLEARRLRVDAGEGRGLWEARVVVRWLERADRPDRAARVVIPVVARGPREGP